MSIFNPPDSLQDIAQTVLDDAGSIADSLQSFTGGLLDPDLFDDVIGDVTEAITLGDNTQLAQILSNFTEYPADILEKLIEESGFLQNISFDNIGSFVSDFLGELEDYGTFIVDYANELFSDVSGGIIGYLDNIVASTGGGAKDTIQSIADRPIPEAEKEQIIKSLQENDVDTASTILSRYSDREISVLKLLLEQLNVTIAGTVVVNSTVGIFPPGYEIGTNLYLWSGGTEPDVNQFSYVSTEEELNAEIRSIVREVTEVVVHWTDTFTNANLTAEQIHDAHTALGHDGIAYHYIIRRDGSLQRGRPVDIEGEHCATNNHNVRSIGIAFVGGLNVATSDSLIEEYSSAASLTRQQYNTFNKFLKYIYLHYPGMQVLGHNDIDPNEEDPGFDVIDYCYTKFNKVSLFDNPSEQEPFTTSEINNFLTEEKISEEYVKNDWVLY